MFAIFTKVNGEWRFEGFMSKDLYLNQGHAIKNQVEHENGDGTFFVCQMPEAE